MRRPLLTSAAIACFLTAVLGVAIFFLFHNHTITEAAAEKIEAGMTLAQVESLLGAKPGRYYRWRDPDVWHTEIDAKGMISESVRTESWTTDHLRVIVALDDRGRVTEFNHLPTRPSGRRGFFLSGENVMPNFLLDWLGWLPPEPNAFPMKVL